MAVPVLVMTDLDESFPMVPWHMPNAGPCTCLHTRPYRTGAVGVSQESSNYIGLASVIGCCVGAFAFGALADDLYRRRTTIKWLMVGP